MECVHLHLHAFKLNWIWYPSQQPVIPTASEKSKRRADIFMGNGSVWYLDKIYLRCIARIWSTMKGIVSCNDLMLNSEQGGAKLNVNQLLSAYFLGSLCISNTLQKPHQSEWQVHLSSVISIYQSHCEGWWPIAFLLASSITFLNSIIKRWPSGHRRASEQAMGPGIEQSQEIW